MNLAQFHTMRTALQDNASPGQDRDLVSVERSLRTLLVKSGAFEQVEVDHTDDPDKLLIALCKFRPQLSETEIARRLEQIWREQVSYPFWEAHTLRVERDHVELEAASRPSPSGHYVTVHLVAQKTRVPSQRVPSE